jgi:hypothetical protein
MSDLLKNIDIMLNEAIASEINTLNIYAKLTEAYERLGNEKHIDVAGLYKPNFFTYMTYIKAHLGELENIKFHVESNMTDKDKRDSENMVSRWNASIKKIPQKDEFSLEGIETWHISHYEMYPNYADIHRPLLKEEAVKLIVSGFSLAFNCSNGTGSILVADNGFAIELWQYMKKTTICKETLDSVLEWMASLYEAESKSFR